MKYVTIRSMIKRRQGEAGIVSIMVTMITMIVISLIVLGFAEIARNEQRNSLDDQLSAQAYYAAESGVNDARAQMETFIAAGNPVPSKTICPDDGNYNLYPTIDASHGVSYPCVLIDAAPQTLSYNIGSTSTVIPLISNSGAFGTITLSWTPASGTSGNLANCPPIKGSVGQFPVAALGGAPWACDYPVLRVDLLNAPGALSRANWNADTSTVFFVPNNANVTVNPPVHGLVVGSKCTGGANGTCTAKFIGLNSQQYYMRVTTIYRTNSTLSLTSSGGKFTGAQAVIDSTGKAQDVLRRILVAVDLTDANSRKIPSGGLVTEDSVCQRYGITSGSFNVYDNSQAAGADSNALCLPASNGSPTP